MSSYWEPDDPASVCKFCDKLIYWIETEPNKFVPCEPNPIPLENIEPGEEYLNEGGEIARGLLIDDNPTVDWYQRHICENYKGPSKGKRSIQEEARRQKEKEWGR